MNAVRLVPHEQWSSETPYSPAVKRGDWVFVSGQIPVDATGVTVGSTMVEQAQQVFTNIQELLAKAGGTLEDVVEITYYVTDIRAFREVTELRKQLFTGAVPPATTALEVASLWDGDHLIEVAAVACVNA